MPAAELIGLAVGITKFLDACIQIIKTAENASGLPSSLHGIALRLPLIQQCFLQARRALAVDKTCDDYYTVALKTVLSASETRAASLHHALLAIVPSTGASRLSRYSKAIAASFQTRKVERLMMEMMQDLQALVASQIFESPSRAYSGSRVIEYQGCIVISVSEGLAQQQFLPPRYTDRQPPDREWDLDCKKIEAMRSSS